MAERSPALTQTDAGLRCVRCGSRIDLCAFCESEDCGHAICYRCLREELGQSLSQPHPHGG